MGLIELLLIVLAIIILVSLIARMLGKTIGVPNDIILLFLVLMILLVFFRGGVHFRL